MMIRLFELIRKNLKLLVRARISALIIFIGPLLLVSLLGLAYSQSSTFTLAASVYSPSYSELSESLITKMTNQNFRVSRMDSSENCIGSVKRSESQACIIFPADMKVEADKSNEITFYVDYSQINLVWLMLDVMSARVSERSEEISKELAGDMLGRIWFVEERIKTGQSQLDSMRSQGESMSAASGNMQSGFKKLDLSVDFSGIDVAGTKAKAENVSALLSSMRLTIANLSNATRSEINSIESSVAKAESGTNDSSVAGELQDIDEAADEISDKIDDAIAAVDSGSDNATAQMAEIKEDLDRILEKLSETQSKLDSVKKKRDDILPELDTLTADLSSMREGIGIVQRTLNESLQKISAVKSKSAESIAAPISTRIEPVSVQKTHFNTLFPTLLVLIIMITGILLAETLVMVEKKSRAFFRNSLTPTSYFTFNMATYITSLFVIVIQLLLFVSVSAFFFETEVIASMDTILLVVFLTATVFICMGMFLGFIFRTEETANLAAITLIAVFLLFSSAVIPLESLPAYLKEIALFSPFVTSEIALKQTMLFNFSFIKIQNSLLLLAAYAFGIFALMIIFQNVLKKISLTQFNRLQLLGKGVPGEKRGSLNLPLKVDKEKHNINELNIDRGKRIKQGPEGRSVDIPGSRSDNTVSGPFYKLRKKSQEK